MIKISRNDEGLWMEFTTADGGKSAMVNVETMAEKHGPIVGDAIREACEEVALSSAPVSAPAIQPELIAAAIAHRVCCGVEHDPQNGKLHGYCVVCGVPWPCDTAKQFLAPAPLSAPVAPEEVAKEITVAILMWCVDNNVDLTDQIRGELVQRLMHVYRKRLSAPDWKMKYPLRICRRLWTQTRN